MGVPIDGLTVFLNQFGAGVSAGNATATTNPDGMINVAGTVIGVGQAAQSVVPIATMPIEIRAVSVVPIADAVLGAAGNGASGSLAVDVQTKNAAINDEVWRLLA